MKIGVFDSGLGGLVITKAFTDILGEYDYIYYGDTKHLPYGDKDSAHILSYTIDAIKYLISQNCGLIIIACNTATSISLRYIQQKFIPSFAPDVKVLGVIIPTVEEALSCQAQNIGVIATSATVKSHIYEQELHKINSALTVKEVAAPKLVPFIEGGDFASAQKAAREYVKDFNNINALILGCTHYPLLKETFRAVLPSDIRVISQDELMGAKLKDYLSRHIEIDICLSRNHEFKVYVSKYTLSYQKTAEFLFPGVKIYEVDNA